MKKQISMVLAGVFAAMMPNTSHAQNQLLMDYNGDGFSDLGIIEISRSGALNWSSVGLGDSQTTPQGTFGSNGAQVAVGSWTAPGVTERGVVTLEKGDRVKWTVAAADGRTLEQEFGVGNVAVVAAMDVNGNGISDPAVIERSGNSLTWKIALDAFSSTPGDLLALKFGTRGVTPFFFNPDGEGDVIAFFKGRRRRGTIRTLDPVSGEQGRFRVKRWMTRNGVEFAPIKQAKGVDYVLATRRKRFAVLDPSGKVITQGRTADSGTTLVGDFLQSTGEEIGVKNKRTGRLTVYNLLSGETQSRNLGEVVAYDAININDLNKAYSSGGSSSSNSSGSAPAGKGLSSVCPKGSKGFSTGALWKPSSDLCHGKSCASQGISPDARHGRPVILLNGGFKNGRGALKIYDSNGNTVCNFTQKPNTNGINKNSDHYFAGWVGGCTKSGREIAALARKSGGSPQVYVEWKGGQCLGPVNPEGRSGGI